MEKFHDLQLNVKGKNNIYESFDEYVSTEVLEGVNKYDAGDVFGKQDAFKKITFISFPPVLHLHLIRYEFNPIAGCLVKINNR